MTTETPEIRPLTQEERKAQKKRNLWLAFALLGFLVLVFVTTIVRIRDGIYWRMPEHSSDVTSRPDPDFVPPADTPAEPGTVESNDE